MLYDGINRFLFRRPGDARRQLALVNNKLRRAEAIIDELIMTLDHSAGDVADRLNALYIYSRRTLRGAHREEPEKVEQVQG